MVYKSPNRREKEENVYERELRDWYFDNGASAVHMANSGAGTQLELPDVLGKYDGSEYAHEVKFTNDDYANVTKERIAGLIRFGRNWGAESVFTIRFSDDIHWYVFIPGTDSFEEVITDDGGMQVSRDNKNAYMTLNELLESGEDATDDDDDDE